MLAKHGSKYVEGPSPTASRFADPAPAVAARPQQDNGSDHPGHGSSGTEPGGRIAADGWAESLGRRRGGALTVKAHLLLLCVAAPSSCSFNDSSVAGDDSDDGRCCMGGCRTVCWQY